MKCNQINNILTLKEYNINFNIITNIYTVGYFFIVMKQKKKCENNQDYDILFFSV